MSTVHEKWMPCAGDSTLTDSNNGQYLAVMVTANARGLGDLPEVSLTGTTATTDEVFGQYMTREADGTVGIATCGILYLRTANAYAAAQNDHGVVASATAGVVQASATAREGFGRIIGGGEATVGGATVDILKVYVPSS